MLLLALASVAGSLDPSEARYDAPADVWEPSIACGACHGEQHAAWSKSAHAHSSLDNPWYLSAFEAIRADEGFQASRHCGGCHDPVLLATGALEGPVGADHPLANEGVTCLVCHGIQETGYAGNGDYRVDLTALVSPTESLQRHAAQMRPAPLQDGTVCRGCHRGFLVPEIGTGSVLVGFDDWGEWETSGWAGIPSTRFDPRKDAPVTCIDCHFAGGHGVPGGRTALAEQTGNLDAVLELLEHSVEVRIPVAWVNGERAVLDGSFAPAEGSGVVLDVAVRNIGAGHSFPGGLADTQDIWLRTTITGSDTTLVAGATSETGVHFRGLPLDPEGAPDRLHRPHQIGVGGFDHSIPPGEVGLVRVAFRAPGGPLQIDAEVVHRSHRPELHEAACAVTTPATLDGCAPQVAHVIATGTLASTDPMGLYVHALGISRGLQEDLEPGLQSLEGREDPQARVLRARILGRQGRVDAALAAVDGLDPKHPAVWRARSDALARVWRWDEAAAALTELAALQPRDPGIWRELARARGSAGDAAGSLEAAEQGLKLQPRDPDLLHARSLALVDLGSPEADAATQRWLDHREPDSASDLRMTCDRLDPECATERTPIPTMRAEPVSQATPRRRAPRRRSGTGEPPRR